MRTSLVCTSCFAACAVAVVSTFGVAQQVAPDDNDPALTKLLEQRRDILAERVTLLNGLSLSGRGSVEDIIAAQNMLIRAKLDLATNSDERLELLRDQVRNIELPEDQAKGQFLIGNINHDTILLAKSARLQAEIELKREENKRP